MEYLDVLDTRGNPTGQKKTKAEIHEAGDWHRAVHVWIVNSKGELLIQKRSPEKDSHPNMWDISGAGHVSSGETPIMSALREVEEELGVSFPKEKFEHLFGLTQQSIQKNGAWKNNEFNDVYLIEADLNVNTLKLQKEEVAEVKFIPYKKFEEEISSGDDKYVPHPEEYRRLFEELHKRYAN